MKKLLLLTLIFPFTSLAQTVQKGLVREFNSGKKPLSGVQVKYIHANSAESDNLGVFTLFFNREIEPGQSIILEEIRKTGYEVVNEKDLQVAKLGNDNKFEEDIILAKTGLIAKAKAEYAGISLNALTASLRRENESLLSLLKDAKIEQEEYLAKLEKLQLEFDKQHVLIDEYAGKFARTNFDDVSAIYEKALTLFKNGDVKACQELLESLNLIERADNRIQERNRATKVIAEETKSLKDNDLGIKEDIKLIRLAVQTLLLDFEFIKAETYYDKLYQLDSTNLEILQEAAHFYSEQHLYEKAKKMYSKITSNEFSSSTTANAYIELGNLYTKTGDLVISDSYYKHANRLFQKQYLTDSTEINKYSLALSYYSLATNYRNLGSINKASEHYAISSGLFKELIMTSPESKLMLKSFATSIQGVGWSFLKLGDLQKSLVNYNAFLELSSELLAKTPDNPDSKYSVSMAYENLGTLYNNLGISDKAKEFYTKSLATRTELYKSFPHNVEYTYGLAITYQHLGNFYFNQADYKNAMVKFKNQRNIFEKLSQTYPTNVFFKAGLGNALGKLGLSQNSMGNRVEALQSFGYNLVICKELIEINPNSLDLKNDLAIAYQFLGEYYTEMKEFEPALEHYHSFKDLEENLVDSKPESIEFRKNLAISYSKLGQTYSSLDKNIEALRYFYDAYYLRKELYEMYSNNFSIKYDFATSYYYLEVTSIAIENYKKARIYYYEYLKLLSELNNKFPDNISYQKSLAYAHFKYGILLKRIDLNLAIKNLELSKKYFAELIILLPENKSFVQAHSTVSKYAIQFENSTNKVKSENKE